MEKLGEIMRYILIAILLPTISFAECNFKSVIKTESGYVYSTECHKRVGKLVKQEPLFLAEIESLNKRITFKDLQIKEYEKKSELWRSTAIDLEKAYNRRSTLSEYSKFLYLGLGVLGTGLAVYSAGRLR
jgi:hypothetical protein